MIAFEVSVNGDKSCVAGVEGLGVLTAILSSVNRASHPSDDPDAYPTKELTLELGGLRTAEDIHVSWLNRPLVVGDVVTIDIKELAVVDEPTATRLQESSEVVREAKRRYYEELKKEIEG